VRVDVVVAWTSRRRVRETWLSLSAN